MVPPISTQNSTCDQLYNPNTINLRLRFQSNLLEDFHTDLPRTGSFINIATSVVESDVIAACASFSQPGQRPALGALLERLAQAKAMYLLRGIALMSNRAVHDVA